MTTQKESAAQPVVKSVSAKKILMGDLVQTVGILPILILIVAVFGFIAPNFFTESNLLNITRKYHAGSLAGTCYDRLHFVRCKILCFIYDAESLG